MKTNSFFATPFRAALPLNHVDWGGGSQSGSFLSIKGHKVLKILYPVCIVLSLYCFHTLCIAMIKYRVSRQYREAI